MAVSSAGGNVVYLYGIAEVAELEGFALIEDEEVETLDV